MGTRSSPRTPGHPWETPRPVGERAGGWGPGGQGGGGCHDWMLPSAAWRAYLQAPDGEPVPSAPGLHGGRARPAAAGATRFVQRQDCSSALA